MYAIATNAPCSLSRKRLMVVIKQLSMHSFQWLGSIELVAAKSVLHCRPPFALQLPGLVRLLLDEVNPLLEVILRFEGHVDRLVVHLEHEDVRLRVA